MDTSAERADRISARNRAASLVRRVTVGMAVSAAAITAGLTGTLAAVSTDTAAATTDSHSTTITTQNRSSGEWGTSSVPEQSSGTGSHTTSGGS